ncbi:MAG: NEW3 domain-containing protein [Peptococcaceae bacterium]
MLTKKTMINKIVTPLMTFILTALLIPAVFPAVEAAAANGLSIYTTFPSIAVKPGENVETDLTVANATGSDKTVEIAVVSLPEGWEAYLEGGGKVVDKIHVSQQYEGKVGLTVKIPKDAQEGPYQVVLSASSGNYSDRLDLEYNIKSAIDNTGKLSTNYTELKGSSETSFKYEVNIKNNKGEAQTYSLGADVERGWQVKFTAKYDSKQIASIPVEPNKSAAVEVEIIPPAKVDAGEYSIPIAASAAGETLTTQLKVIITGSYGMELTTPTGRLNAETTAGKEKAVDIVLENTGSSELQGIKLSSWQPDGWNVRFAQDAIDTIAPGESATVKAFIKPDEKAITGDYVVKIAADTPETSSSAEFRVMVKTSTVWGIIGVLVIIFLVTGLYWTFNTYGRR